MVFAVTGSMLAWGLTEARAAVPASAPSRDGVRSVCPAADGVGMRCHALELTAPAGGTSMGRVGPASRPVVVAGAAQTPECHIPRASEGCYGSTRGSGRRIRAPQDSGLDANDCDRHRRGRSEDQEGPRQLRQRIRAGGLPGETSCPTVLDGQGKRHLPAAEGDAPLETSLDVEVAHAICPGCELLLIEASLRLACGLRRSHRYRCAPRRR